MNRTLKHLLVGLISVGFLAASAALLFPKTPVQLLFCAFPVLILAIQFMGYGPGAFMMMGFTTLLGIFTLSRSAGENAHAVPLILFNLFVASALLHWHMQKAAIRERSSRDKADDARKQIQSLTGEVSFYEKRLAQLAQNGEQRGQL
jgi:hypothetical protein